MLWWLVDNANVLIVLLGLLVLALAAAWWNTRNRKVGMAALVVLGLVLLIWILSLRIVTDRKKLVANVQNMVDAVSANKIDDAMNYFADEVKVSALGQPFHGSRKELGDMTRSKLQQTNLKGFVVWSIDVVRLERPKARVTFYVRPEEDQKFVQCQADFIMVSEMDWRIENLRIDLPGQGPAP